MRGTPGRVRGRRGCSGPGAPAPGAVSAAAARQHSPRRLASPPGSEPGLGCCLLAALVGAPAGGGFAPALRAGFRGHQLPAVVALDAASPPAVSPSSSLRVTRAPGTASSEGPHPTTRAGGSGAVGLRPAQSPACEGRTGGRGGGAVGQKQPASQGRDPRARRQLLSTARTPRPARWRRPRGF